MHLSTPTRALLLLSLGGVSRLDAQEVTGRTGTSFDVREMMRAGQHLRVASPNGRVTVLSSGDGSASVHAEKEMSRGRSADEIGFIVVRTAEGLAVCAVHDDNDGCDLERGYRQSRRSDRYGWSNSRAHFTVRVPAGVRVSMTSGNGDLAASDVDGALVAETGNGDVSVTETRGTVHVGTGNGKIVVQGASGSVRARTGNGEVRVATASGPVNAHTGNGRVVVSMASLAADTPMEFTTGNGDITLDVPANLGAELDVSTGNGSIRSELPVSVRGRLSERRLHGTIGTGGAVLRLQTGSGDVAIRRVP